MIERLNAPRFATDLTSMLTISADLDRLQDGAA
jgi:hypothetical protein